MDWAHEQIEELESLGLADADDCCKAFVSAYKNGDSVESYTAFVASAKVYHFSDEQYFLAIFPDQSAYADWKQGIDRFYPTVSDLAEEDDDVAKILEAA